MYKKCMDILIVFTISNTHDSGTFSFQCINSGICSIGDIGDRKITENGIGTTTHGSNMFQPMEKPTRVSHPRAVTGGPWLISHLHCWGKAPKDRSAVNCAWNSKAPTRASSRQISWSEISWKFRGKKKTKCELMKKCIEYILQTKNAILFYRPYNIHIYIYSYIYIHW